MHKKIIEPLIDHFENCKGFDEPMIKSLQQSESYTPENKAKALENLNKAKSAERSRSTTTQCCWFCIS